MVAPMDSARSAICSESRVLVPSWIMSMASRAVPGLAEASAAKPASAISVKSTTGAAWRSTTTTSRPLESLARAGPGSLSDGGVPVAGTLLRSTVEATRLVLAHGFHVEHEHAIRQPAFRRTLHVRRRGAAHPAQPGLVEIRRAAVHQALGQDVGLAAEAIDTLDAAREAGVVGGTDAVQLRRRRPLGQECGQFLVQRLLDRRRIRTRLRPWRTTSVARRFRTGRCTRPPRSRCGPCTPAACTAGCSCRRRAGPR